MIKKQIFCTKSDLIAGDKGIIRGYASVFGGVDCYEDTIEPTAYDNVLKSGELPKMFFNHDSFSLPIGKWDHIEKDNKGLIVEGKLNLDLPEGNSIYSAIKFGSLDGLSIGFCMNKGDYTYDGDVRIIKNVSKLVEVSVVSFPADTSARISEVKCADIDNLETLSDVEHYLRDAGNLSRKDATATIGRIKKILSNQCETEKALDLQSVVEKLQSLNTKLKGE